MTRSIQEHNHDTRKEKTIGILIHGDGAFAGQGVVYENLQMQDLAPYDIGGVVHIVCNNQIAFTTVPNQSRSGLYCTDLAKAVGAPILHVNADDPESVTRSLQFAYDYRKKFKKDVVIDLIGYRKYGHNELDQPAFTQPLMYQKIQQMVPVCDQYEATLLKEGVLTEAQVKAMKEEFHAKLQLAFDISKDPAKQKDLQWSRRFKVPIKAVQINDHTPSGQGVKLEYLQSLYAKYSKLKEGFTLHPQLKKIFDARDKSMSTGEHIDFGTAEHLAFSSLIEEGYGVRLTGQDVQRGTFSHRHAVVHDQVNRE